MGVIFIPGDNVKSKEKHERGRYKQPVNREPEYQREYEVHEGQVQGVTAMVKEFSEGTALARSSGLFPVNGIKRCIYPDRSTDAKHQTLEES